MLWLSLLACTQPADTCAGPTTHVYDPLVSSRLDAWPDDVFTRVDENSPTDLRVEVVGTPWFDALPELFQGIATGVHGASGFGTQAELFVRFDGPVGTLPTVEESTTTDAIQLWDLDRDPPERVPFEARTAAGDQQIMLLPVGPLRPKTAHALVVTAAQTDSEGRCMAPSPVLKSVLDRTPTAPWDDRVKPTKRLLRELSIERDAVTALLTFTTHADHLDFLEAGQQARDEEQAWAGGFSCEARDGHRVCETTFDPYDFRGPDTLVVPNATERYSVPVTFWLPDGIEDPPLIVFGHGLGQQRGDAEEFADLVLSLGMAMVASDALFHGDHPTSDGTSDPTAFLGLRLSGGIGFDLAGMRSSFDQSNLDRRQLVTLLGEHPDVDGDGTPEFDPDRLAYVGVSLGGILGSGLLTLSDDLDAAVLAIAGGNLVSIVRDTDAVAPFRSLFVNLAGGEEQLEAAYSVLQTAIDPSDPALFASTVLQRRVTEGPAPHLLLPVATDDEVVPFDAGRALARALGLPHVRPLAVPVAGLDDAGAAPLSGNGPDGATVGYFQYDRMTLNGELQASRHVMVRSEEFGEQLRHFLDTWIDGSPVILDPFATRQTPPLP